MHYSETRLEQFIGANGEKRPIHIWETNTPKAILIGIHGGMAHAGDYVTPALYFKEKQFTTVAHDMRGHVGQRRVYIDSFDGFLDDLDLFIEWVKICYPDLPIFLLAHSMGGLVAAHYALKKHAGTNDLSGYIISSPYFANAIETPPIMRALAPILNTFVPKMKVPINSLNSVLTHDEAITQRHIADSTSDARAQEPSVRFAYELLKAQNWVQENFVNWDQPLFLVVAGDDYLADAQITLNMASSIDQTLIEQHYYPDNYHENFNETNREEIFQLIEQWLEKRLA